MPKFDWVPRHDIRSLDYSVRQLLPPVPTRIDKMLMARIDRLEEAVFGEAGPPIPDPPPAPSEAINWKGYVNLDQEQDGECVGYGFAHDLDADPLHNPVVGLQTTQNPTAEWIYEEAQRQDGSPPDEDSGASVLGGAKACKLAGYLNSYWWCLSIQDVKDTILHISPVVLGIPWTKDMTNPASNGVIRATGKVMGGHCILATGYDPASQMFRLKNSWGTGWGKKGDAFIPAADLKMLLGQQGEACVTVKVKL